MRYSLAVVLFIAGACGGSGPEDQIPLSDVRLRRTYKIVKVSDGLNTNAIPDAAFGSSGDSIFYLDSGSVTFLSTLMAEGHLYGHATVNPCHVGTPCPTTVTLGEHTISVYTLKRDSLSYSSFEFYTGPIDDLVSVSWPGPDSLRLTRLTMMGKFGSGPAITTWWK